MDPDEILGFITRVLKVFDDGDIHGELFWRVSDQGVRLFATCNDTFWWATADVEEITPDNVALLEQALVDLEAIDARSGTTIYVPELFAARVRRLRPQRPWYEKKLPEVAVLFDACGPERDRKDEG